MEFHCNTPRSKSTQHLLAGARVYTASKQGWCGSVALDPRVSTNRSCEKWSLMWFNETPRQHGGIGRCQHSLTALRAWQLTLQTISLTAVDSSAKLKEHLGPVPMSPAGLQGSLMVHF